MFGKNDQSDKSMPYIKQVGDYTVRKLVLREYIDVFNRIERIPQEIAKLDGIDESNMGQHIGKIVANALPDVIAILAVVTNREEEEMENVDLNTAIDLLVATVEINDFLGVAQKIKGILPQARAIQTQESGSNE